MSSNLWDKSLCVLRERIDARAFDAWLATTKFGSYENGHLIVHVPNSFAATWISEYYSDAIRSVAASFADDFKYVSFIPNDAIQQDDKRPTAKERVPEIIEEPQQSMGTVPPPHLNPKYTFEEFVVGPANRFAHAAAKAVCETPARAYNPLFIYGGAGLGKTHLMQAIGHEILRKNALKVLYITSEEFTNELISAIQQRSQMAFRNKYRTVDVLLIDDIHFIAGKDATQEEFFHTFNTLHGAYKQVILSSDRPPKDIPTLEERLVSRFEWGLVTDVQPPDIETRIAILQKKSEKSQLRCPSELLFFIANLVRANIRELEGAFNRVIGYASAHNCSLTIETGELALKDLLEQSATKQITVDLIKKVTASHFNVRYTDMESPKRSKLIAFSRQVAMFLARENTQASLIDIGDAFGGRDHSTVLYACKKVRDALKNDSQLAKDIEAITKQLKA